MDSIYKSLLLLCLGSWISLTFAAAQSIPVVVKGVDDDLLQNVRNYLNLDEDGRLQVHYVPPSPHRRIALSKQIRQALEALGYYEAQVQQNWQDNTLVVQIDPGEPVRIASINLDITEDGAGDPAFTAVRKAPGLAVGDALHHGHYEDLKSRLRNIALQQGYFDARFTVAQVSVNRASRQANIQLAYATGPRYRFGDIRIAQDALNDPLVKELVPFSPGDPFEQSALVELQHRLESTGYFSQVVVDAQHQDATDHQVPVNAQLTRIKKWKYDTGLGYGTDTGPRLSVAAQNRLANRKGHRYGARASASQLEQEAVVFYDIPMNISRGDLLHLELGQESVEDDLGETEIRTALTQYDINRAPGVKDSLFLKIQEERFQPEEDLEQRSLLILPGIRHAFWSSNDVLYPTAGHRVQLMVQGTVKEIGSDIPFLQGRADVKWLHGLGFLGTWGKNQRLILRGSAGYTLIADSDLDQLPLSLRFATGGDQSVRGYDYNSLGPKNDNGDNIGGRYLVTASAEWDFRVRENWLAAVFFDTGNAFNDENDFELLSGVGIGVRWLSPVGPIRLDLAHPLDGDESGIRIHITMGPDL